MDNKNEISKLDLKKCLELKDEDKIYQFLFDKVFELGKVIIDIKGIKHEEPGFLKDDIELELYSISQDIYYGSIWFESYRILSDKVRIQYVNDILEEKAKYIVKLYNNLIDEIDEYKQQKERIEEEGFEKLDKELKNGLKEIFCKMLDYKNRKYNKDFSLPQLIEELELCYSDYKWIFDDTYMMLTSKMVYRNTEIDDFWTIHADNVEYISNLEFTFKYFSKNEDSYKNYTQYYEDITLKEGQTLKDLYDEEREKLRNLFIEMLEFINIKIPDDRHSSNLEMLVKKYYPFYNNNFITINGTCNYSYIDSIHVLKKNYDYFKKTYKNHKDMFKRYIKEEEEWFEEAKHNDEIHYDPEWIDDLNKLKEQFGKYFENE